MSDEDRIDENVELAPESRDVTEPEPAPEAVPGSLPGDASLARGDTTSAPTPYEPPPAPGPLSAKKRTGLVVVVAALLLLLVAAVAGVALLKPAFTTTTTAVEKRDTTKDKARITVAIGVMEALRINDLAAVKPFLTDAAQKAITPEEWTAAAATSEVPTATYSPATWAGDTTATVKYDIEGSAGTMTFAPNPTKANVVTMTESGLDGELIYDIELVAVGSGWRAVSLTPKAETFLLDEEFVKSLIEVPAP
jgi:hypothetical protein